MLEPLKKTPAAGEYEYNLLPQDSPIRKALYVSEWWICYETITRDQCFHGWSDTDAYVIGHLTVAISMITTMMQAGHFMALRKIY